jgi:hypothetical protein
MTANVRVHIRCDYPGCYCQFESYERTATAARAEATKNGWTRVAGLDFCGKPEQAVGWTHREEAKGWGGHAALTDHLPQVKPIPRNKGYVRLSCSCGWEYVPEWKWQAGALLTSVDYKWGEHVEQATKEAPTCVGTDMNCGRPLPCPDHPAAAPATA